MDCFEYDIIERHVNIFHKKIQSRMERERMLDKGNTKSILPSLYLDYSPEQSNKKDKNEIIAQKVFIKKTKDYLDNKSKKQQSDVSPTPLDNDQSTKVVALHIIDVTLDKVISTIQENQLKIIASKASEQIISSHLIKIYIFNTQTNVDIETEQCDTIRDLKQKIINMIKTEMRVNMTSLLPDDYELFEHKQDNDTNEIMRNSNIEKPINEKVFVRMLKSKILCFEMKKDRNNDTIINTEKKEENMKIKVHFIDIENVEGMTEITISNSKTLKDLLILISKQIEFSCNNLDLYYFRRHHNNKREIDENISVFDDNLDDSIHLNVIKEYEFDLGFLMFAKIPEIDNPQKNKKHSTSTTHLNKNK